MSKAAQARGCAVLAVVVLALAGSASAQDAPPVPSAPTVGDGAESGVASSLYENGLSLFARGSFEAAVAEFRKAYEVEARADFLLQIGRSFDKLGQTQKALYFFKRYLSTAPPNADSRPEAQAYVSRFEEPPTAEPTTASIPTSDLVHVPESSPVWHRWWFWTTVGIVVVGAVTLGVALSSDDGAGRPVSDLGHMRF